eukprot:gene23540-biopygen17823
MRLLAEKWWGTWKTDVPQVHQIRTISPGTGHMDSSLQTPPSKSGFIPVQLSPVSFPLSPTQSGLMTAQSSSVRAQSGSVQLILGTFRLSPADSGRSPAQYGLVPAQSSSFQAHSSFQLSPGSVQQLSSDRP